MTFTYDGDSHVQSAATSGPGTGQPSVLLSYTYDQAGNKTVLTDNLSSAGMTSYSYDANEQTTGVASSYGGAAGPSVAYNYDSGGRMTSESRTVGGGGSAHTSFGYDAANRETTIANAYIISGSGGSTTPLGTYVYGYDNANRVTTQVNADGTYTYTYDNANELTGVDKNGTSVEAYAYDLNGNRTGTGYSTTVMNETATSPGITYTYDNAGNTISSKSGTTITTYTYDFHNRLTEVTQGGTVIATYAYDALNRRIGVDDSGSQTWTVYDGTNPYADFNGSGTLQQRYQYGPGVVDGAIVDQLLARTSSGGATAWYLPDKLGSVRDIVSTSGTELDHIVYDSFGNILTETNSANGDRFKYAGMEYDSATAQYYDIARYYDQVTGAFVSQDPAGYKAGGSNLFVYVDNNATDAVDPLGLFPTSGGYPAGGHGGGGGGGRGGSSLPGSGRTSTTLGPTPGSTSAPLNLPQTNGGGAGQPATNSHVPDSAFRGNPNPVSISRGGTAPGQPKSAGPGGSQSFNPKTFGGALPSSLNNSKSYIPGSTLILINYPLTSSGMKAQQEAYEQLVAFDAQQMELEMMYGEELAAEVCFAAVKNAIAASKKVRGTQSTGPSALAIIDAQILASDVQTAYEMYYSSHYKSNYVYDLTP